jgi:hypothetical protein
VGDELGWAPAQVDVLFARPAMARIRDRGFIESVPLPGTSPVARNRTIPGVKQIVVLKLVSVPDMRLIAERLGLPEPRST